jgi:hypothetical protein
MDGSSNVAPAGYNIDNNPAGPGDLLQTYLLATDQFVLGQYYSEAVMKQQPLDVSSAGVDLALKVAAFQNRMQSQATYFYQNLINSNYGFISSVAGAYNLCALMNAAATLSAPDILQAPTNATARSTASSAFSAVASQAESVQVTANTLATKAFVANQSLNQYIGSYQQTLQAVEDNLEQAAKDTLTQIDALKQAINQNISDIVTGASQVGGAVTNLMVGILTSIPTDKAGGGDAGGDAKSTTGASTANASTTDASSSQENPGSFAVLAIQAATSGETTLSQAAQDLTANNQKLAAAYQSLAAADQLLAVAKAVDVQTQMFSSMLPLAAGNAHDLVISLNGVQANMTAFAGTIANLTTDAAAQAAANQVQTAALSWTAFASELQSMKTMLVS